MSRRPRTVHEQRVARALRTMAPGGRLASESPVRRPRFTGGAPYVPPTALRPDLIGPWYGETALPSGTYVGGAGQDTLRDDSDSTYLLIDQGLDALGDERQVAFAFEAGTFASITACTLRIRAKSPNSTNLYVAISGSYVRTPGSGTPYYYAPDYAVLTTGWANYDFTWTTGGGDWNDGVLPSLSALSAGTVEVLVNVRQSAPYNGHVAHLAEAWLEITP